MDDLEARATGIVSPVLSTGETIPVARASKAAIAQRIFDEMLKLRLALHSAK